MTSRKCKIAIVGAGIAGLTAATHLYKQGIGAVVVDKARGPGGRTSTRRNGELRFDHGAQYFTARHEDFTGVVKGWHEAGIVQPWHGRIVSIDANGETRPLHSSTTRYVGAPGMNAMCRHMAQKVDCMFNTRVTALHHDTHWRLSLDGGGTIEADELILSLPPDQCAALLKNVSTSVLGRVNEVTMQPCWAAMLALGTSVQMPFDAAFVNRGPLSWIANDSSKPGRPTRDCWVLHASSEFSSQHVNADGDDVTRTLLDAFGEIAGENINVQHIALHRWLYSQASRALQVECLHDHQTGLYVIGDWCAGSRIEGACLSGLAAARSIASGRGL